MLPSQIGPIEESKRTIAAIVHDRIRDAILDGHLAAGSRIDQGQLAEALNVSLVPVREALKKLEAEGFVQIFPRRGAFVTRTSLSDMDDLYFARKLLEGQAAYHAAENLSEEAITELTALMPQMTGALEKHDFVKFMECNHRFHFVIYEAAGSRYLTNMITSLWELAERYRYRYVLLRDQGPIIQAEHQAILEACIAHNKERLRDAVTHHMQQTLIGVRAYLVARLPGTHEE